MKLFLNTLPYKTCYHIEGNLDIEEEKLVIKILSRNFTEFIPDEYFAENNIEAGPRRNFKTSLEFKCLPNTKRCGIKNLDGIEFTTFYPKDYKNYDKILLEEFQEERPDISKELCFSVDNIPDFNLKNKLGFDQQDIDYYEDIFSNIGRNPTNIELYDLGSM